jgi:hypothetical protein
VAIIHYDVTFQDTVPTLLDLKHQIERRTGLTVHLWKDSLDKDLDHEWPHIGHIRESGTLECDECDEADLEVTVGTHGVRITFVDPSVQLYFRDQVVQSLVDLGGEWKAKLSPLVTKKWNELQAADRSAIGA